MIHERITPYENDHQVNHHQSPDSNSSIRYIPGDPDVGAPVRHTGGEVVDGGSLMTTRQPPHVVLALIGVIDLGGHTYMTSTMAMGEGVPKARICKEDCLESMSVPNKVDGSTCTLREHYFLFCCVTSSVMVPNQTATMATTATAAAAPQDQERMPKPYTCTYYSFGAICDQATKGGGKRHDSTFCRRRTSSAPLDVIFVSVLEQFDGLLDGRHSARLPHGRGGEVAVRPGSAPVGHGFGVDGHDDAELLGHPADNIFNFARSGLNLSFYTQIKISSACSTNQNSRKVHIFH